VNCSNYLNVHYQSLKFCVLNARSVRNKTADILDYICECKLDVVGITESWLSSDDAAVRTELCPDGYKFLDHPRDGLRGGGTGLIYRDSLCVKKLDAGIKRSFEFSEWSVTTSSHKLRIVVLYRPPYSSEHNVPMSVFFNEFSNYLESLLLSKEPLLISGDFNIHIDDAADADSFKFQDLLESVGLRQHVTQATHTHGHTLDLIITRCSDQIIMNQPYVDRFISDHASVICDLLPAKPVMSIKRVSYRKLKCVNMTSLNQDLAATALCATCRGEPTNLLPDDVDALARDYNETLSSLTNCHAPLKTKSVRTRASAPWYNGEIDAAKRLRRKAERIWRKSKLLSDFNQFKVKRNRVTYLMNEARRTFYTNFIKENSDNQGKLFRAVNKLLVVKDELCFPNYHNNTALATDIGEFFVRKISRIRSDIDAMVVDSSASDLVPDDRVVNKDIALNSFRCLTENEVQDLIQASAKKSCALDPMPTSLVIRLTPLRPVITHIINSSLLTGHFPDKWKEALVKPLIKKKGLDALFTNLRPISNLQYISKLTERAVYDQTYHHMMTHELFPLLQSAYRKGHSTETALLRVQNDILMNMDRQQVTLLVLLDLSAAFDTVDHRILLHRMETSFGITGTVLEWFRSYLTNRSQRVVFGEGQSKSFQLPYGVPQGSCLGPLLFTVYSSKLFDIIKKYLPTVHAFADDTQLYLSFQPNSRTSEAEAIEAMELCIKALRVWMITDKMKLNDDKTEFMLLGTHQQLSKVCIEKLFVGDVTVTPVSVSRNLGVWFDSHMSYVTHINKTCKAAFFHLHNIRRIRKFLSNEAAQTLVHAYVMGKLDYCNSLLFGLPDKQIKKLQRVQNAAARLISYTPRFGHITPVLRTLHWLPIRFRIEFKMLVIIFKSIHGLSPVYISDLISTKLQSKYCLRSNNELLLAPKVTKTKKTLGDRAFTAAAPKLFNELPREIRTVTNLNHFKTLIKTFLFRKAYDIV
jgi:exonuclease III